MNECVAAAASCLTACATRLPCPPRSEIIPLLKAQIKAMGPPPGAER